MPSERDTIIGYGVSTTVAAGLFTVFCLVVAGLLAFKAGDLRAAGDMVILAALSILVGVACVIETKRSLRDASMNPPGPSVADQAVNPPADSCHRSVPARAPIDWEKRLVAAFRQQEVRDGYNHPADAIIADVLRNGAADDHKRLLRIAVDAADPVTAYGVLHSLTHVDIPWDNLRKADLAQSALASPDATIRDAGIRLVEHWPCRETLSVIERHRDADKMLADYARAVAHDIRASLSPVASGA